MSPSCAGEGASLNLGELGWQGRLRFGTCRVRDTCTAMPTPFSAERAWSLLHPWVVRGVGVHGWTTAINGFGAQFVVPGFVAVDLAQPVLGAVLGQPGRGIERPDVDCVARHVGRRVGGGHPSGSFLF